MPINDFCHRIEIDLFNLELNRVENWFFFNSIIECTYRYKDLSYFKEQQLFHFERERMEGLEREEQYLNSVQVCQKYAPHLVYGDEKMEALAGDIDRKKISDV